MPGKATGTYIGLYPIPHDLLGKIITKIAQKLVLRSFVAGPQQGFKRGKQFRWIFL